MQLLKRSFRFAAMAFFVSIPAICPAQVTFSEKCADKVAGVRDFGQTYYELLENGNFAVRFKFTIPEGLVPNADTPVDITVGDWSFSGYFSDDPKYRAGSAKANIPLAGGKLSLAISSTAVTGAITAKTGFNARYDTYEDSPAGRNLAGPSRLVNLADNEKVDFSCSLGQPDWVATSSFPISGAVVTKTLKRGPRDFPDEFDVSRIKLAGGAAITVAPPPQEPEDGVEEKPAAQP